MGSTGFIRERELVKRAALRGEAVEPIQGLELYWRGLACGWDALAIAYRRPERGGPGLVLPADQSPFWIWWSTLHPARRRLLIKLSRAVAEAEHDPRGLAPDVPAIEQLNNPAFVIERKEAE